MNKKAKLKLSIQDQQGLREFSLDGNGPWTIGRGEDAEVTLQEKRSSRRHARITAESGTLLIFSERFKFLKTSTESLRIR